MYWFPIAAAIAILSRVWATRLARRQQGTAPEHALRLRRILRVSVILAVVLAGGGILLLGIPGALFMELVDGMLGRDVLSRIGDGAWPLALAISLLWPWPAPLGAVAWAASRPNARPLLAYLLGVGLAAVYGLIVTAVMMALQ